MHAAVSHLVRHEGERSRDLPRRNGGIYRATKLGLGQGCKIGRPMLAHEAREGILPRIDLPRPATAGAGLFHSRTKGIAMRLATALCAMLLATPAAAGDVCKNGDLETTLRSAAEASKAVHGAVLMVDNPETAGAIAVGLYADDGKTSPGVSKIVIVATPAGDVFLGMIGADGCFVEVLKTSMERFKSLLKTDGA